MDSVKKVNDVCKSVLKITVEDLQAVEQMAEEQAGYINPLKNAKQSKVNELANHNQRVLSALKHLRNVLINADNSVKNK